MTRNAVFWDRDNTLISDPGYISDPDLVELLPGAADAVRRLAEAGFENVLVTNQSGIARGLFDEATLDKIHDRLRELLAADGATIDAIYYCPYLDSKDAKVDAYRKASPLRKPKPGMLLQASSERKIDLPGSWIIGDSVRDAQAGRAAGCRTVLVAADASQRASLGKRREVDFAVASLADAVEIVLKHTRSRTAVGKRPEGDDAAATLQEILNFMRMVDRRQRTEDFSLTRMAGAIVQLLALAALVWAVFGLIWSDPLGVQLLRLGYVLVLQLLALTLFIVSSRR